MSVEVGAQAEIQASTVELQGPDQKENIAFDNPKLQNIRSQEEIQQEQQDSWRERFQEWLNAEICCYAVFLVVFCLLTSLIRGAGGNGFTATDGVRTALITNPFNTAIGNGEKTYLEVSTPQDVYVWIETVFIPIVFPNTYPGSGTNITAGISQYLVNQQQRLLGGVRIRQYRSQSEPCAVANNLFSNCHSERSEAKTDFTIGGKTYKWQSAETLNDQLWQARFRSTYPGSGYVEDIPPDRTSAQTAIKFLKDNDWIDQATRLLVLDFNTLNPSANLHTVVRIAFEMPVSGGIFPYHEIKTWRFLRYIGTTGTQTFAFSILFLIFVLYFTVIFFLQLFQLGCDCQTGIWSVSNWTVVDLLNLVFYYSTIVTSILLITSIEPQKKVLDINNFISFRRIQYYAQWETYMQSMNGFLLFIKVFKYMNGNRRLSFFFDLMQKAAQDILMFLCVLIVFFFAFGILGFTLFASDISDFRDFGFSMANMLRFLLTPLNYQELLLSNRAIGSAFYFMWTMLTVLMLLNVFIAILNEAYAQIQEDLTEDDKLNMDFFGFSRTMTRVKSFFKRRSQININIDDYDRDQDGKLDVNELMSTGLTRDKAKSVVQAYDADGDGKLNEKELAVMRKDVVMASIAMDDDNGQMEEIAERLDRLENMLQTLIESQPKRGGGASTTL